MRSVLSFFVEFSQIGRCTASKCGCCQFLDFDRISRDKMWKKTCQEVKISKGVILRNLNPENVSKRKIKKNNFLIVGFAINSCILGDRRCKSDWVTSGYFHQLYKNFSRFSCRNSLDRQNTSCCPGSCFWIGYTQFFLTYFFYYFARMLWKDIRLFAGVHIFQSVLQDLENLKKV